VLFAPWVLLSDLTQKHTLWVCLRCARIQKYRHSYEIWKIQLKRFDVSHKMPHTVAEDNTVLTSFAHVLDVWFLQIAILQTQNRFCMAIIDCTRHSHQIGHFQDLQTNCF
jgi:hypothetical protein